MTSIFLILRLWEQELTCRACNLTSTAAITQINMPSQQMKDSSTPFLACFRWTLGGDEGQKTSRAQVDLTAALRRAERFGAREHLSKHNISRYSCVPGDLLQTHLRNVDFSPSAAMRCNKSLAADLWPSLRKSAVRWRKKSTLVNFRPWQLVSSRNTRASRMWVDCFLQTLRTCARWGAAAALWINKQELAFIWHCRINLLPEGSRGQTTDLHNCNFMILDFFAFAVWLQSLK